MAAMDCINIISTRKQTLHRVPVFTTQLIAVTSNAPPTVPCTSWRRVLRDEMKFLHKLNLGLCELHAEAEAAAQVAASSQPASLGMLKI